jgi:hypothetical protein
MVDEAHFMDAREDVIYKFYEGRMSFKAAEAMAVLWARSFEHNEWADPMTTAIAEKLQLDWQECYLILGNRKKYFFEMKNQPFWRWPECYHRPKYYSEPDYE